MGSHSFFLLSIFVICWACIDDLSVQATKFVNYAAGDDDTEELTTASHGLPYVQKTTSLTKEHEYALKNIADGKEENNNGAHFNSTSNQNMSLSQILNNITTGQLVQQLIVRKDGMNHLLYSDVDRMLNKIAAEFPDIAKVYSIGKSTDGRDIRVVELDGGSPSTLATTILNEAQQNNTDLLQADAIGSGLNDQSSGNASTPSTSASKPAILITGATHARELISTSLVIYELLKLIQLGYLKKEAKYVQLLQQNKYLFMPILNVDGVAFIEENWVSRGQFVSMRKNNNHRYACDGTSANTGVDLNRNFGVDFGVYDQGSPNIGQLDFENSRSNENKKSDPCFNYFPGPKPFSEAETQAFRDFATSKKDQLAFIINVHSTGPAFIYPFNGRQRNDIEMRRPGILQIFTQIATEAPFPRGTSKGNSKEVMGIAIGGDQDDWALDELGIPSVCAEIGSTGQFIDEWQLQSISEGNIICSDHSQWIEYVFEQLPNFQKIVQEARQKKK